MSQVGKNNSKEHLHILSKDVKMTLDGKPCKAEELKPGTKIRVTTIKGDMKVAIHIEGIDKQELFANTHDGKIVSISDSRLVMTDREGKEHAHALADHVKSTCDGKTCKLSDLKAGMKIRVTTKENSEGVVIGIEAIDHDTSFVLLD